jgi:hypothetical protein
MYFLSEKLLLKGTLRDIFRRTTARACQKIFHNRHGAVLLKLQTMKESL